MVNRTSSILKPNGSSRNTKKKPAHLDRGERCRRIPSLVKRETSLANRALEK